MIPTGYNFLIIILVSLNYQLIITFVCKPTSSLMLHFLPYYYFLSYWYANSTVRLITLQTVLILHIAIISSNFYRISASLLKMAPIYRRYLWINRSIDRVIPATCAVISPDMAVYSWLLFISVATLTSFANKLGLFLFVCTYKWWVSFLTNIIPISLFLD